MVSNYVNSFIMSSESNFLSNYYVPGTMLCSSAMGVNKTDVKQLLSPKIL